MSKLVYVWVCGWMGGEGRGLDGFTVHFLLCSDWMAIQRSILERTRHSTIVIVVIGIYNIVDSDTLLRRLLRIVSHCISLNQANRKHSLFLG